MVMVENGKYHRTVLLLAEGLERIHQDMEIHVRQTL